MTMLAAPLALAACDSAEQSAGTAEDTPMAQDMPMADDMPMDAAEGQTASGRGTVTAIDAEAGTITIDHEPIPEANWPAMTMGFQADETERAKVEVGDKVEFDLKLTGNAGEITRIETQ
jgi:Cu(I)/Ag(I) efflux system protein CusF